MLYYSFARLDSRSNPTAAAANEAIFLPGSQVYGIEVTVPALSGKCIANLDPQHEGQHQWPMGNCPASCGGKTIGWVRNGEAYSSCTTRGCCSQNLGVMAAIEMAMYSELPEQGTVLVTVRPDLDSIGTMAFMEHRAACDQSAKNAQREDLLFGRGSWEPTGDFLKRLLKIAKADKLAMRNYTPCPLPTRDNPWPPEAASVEGVRELAAINAAACDESLALLERVQLVQTWLLTGEEPAKYREQVEQQRSELIEALEGNKIKYMTVADGRVAVVESLHNAALSVGYSLAPVVVALNPCVKTESQPPYRKFTVCTFEKGKYIDLLSALSELAKLESGWGGSAIIGGSPQRISSILTMDKVLEVVVRHLK